MSRYVIAAALWAVLSVAPVGMTPAWAAADQQTAQREPTPGQLAARERQRKCAAEWKELKAAGKTAGMTWPKFWSACNTRLKAQAQ